MLSIIIPTLNEEKYLPQLLESIKKQSFRDYEIIVADANSKDRTREIAKEYGCKVVEGGLPARGRNKGVDVATGDLFLFIDADVTLDANFLDIALYELISRNLGIASFLLDPKTRSLFLRFIFAIYNRILLITERLIPLGGVVILVKREVHFRLGGFDEKITFGEDTEYIRRGAKICKFGFIRGTKIGFSLRRFQKSGHLKTLFQYIIGGIYILFFGFPRKNILGYKFDIYRD